jgi:hypothetical protein
MRRRHTTAVTTPVEMIVPRDADPGVRVCSEAWAECLREQGVDVQIADISDASSAATTVIVAPHAALGPLADDPVRIASVLNRAVCVTTSRLGSGALAADAPFHSAAAASVALSRDASRHLVARGVPTAHLKPGSHAQLCSSSVEPRVVSVGMHARRSTFREDILTRSRDVLSPHPYDLRISDDATGPPVHLAPDEWRRWLTSLDVLLSLPPESGPGTDWCELAPAVMNGAVVLTTAESDFGPLEPGGDIATATGVGFADSLRRLLADGERRARMRESARASLAAIPLDVTPLADAILSVMTARRRARPFRSVHLRPIGANGA